MNADISLTAPEPPRLSAHRNHIAGAIVAAVAVTILALCSFGLVMDLMVVVAVRMMGAPDAMVWAAGGIGSLGALAFSMWVGWQAWQHELTAD
ncbi:MAG: hypothetical protein JJ855_04255 [Rhodospirillales bacterium]|nr:hypothetical protein [Rhodospirillales bacterium]